MQCWIYKGTNRGETYLYLGAENGTDPVPNELLQALGALELIMKMELSDTSKLARANPANVMQQIRECGYYLQLPPPPVDRPGPGRLQ